ncbi:hypothetical protein [Tepidibacter aestuarii]|uniref:hypothetical protein n=1 Tax=Tepidibacter aestuarii TaxID=2925782 RepID=UPI0020BF934D|nr:hypothetical protein [Tepidibacter aestuarii]CAH2212125.1 Vitamin B12 dependent methionine synthase activation region [Tepidibacter aestuarii]
MDVNVLYNFNIEKEIDSICQRVDELKGLEDDVLEIKKYIKPCIYYKDINIKSIEKDKVVLDEIEIDSAYLAKGLSGCHKITLIVLSIGDYLNKYSKEKYHSLEFKKSSVADILGSHAVEILIDKFHNYLISKNILSGIHSSLRFSPGYGDWDLRYQKNILDILKTHKDINVSSNFLLQPIKSVTAIIGWSYQIKERNYPTGYKKEICKGINSCSNCRTWACKK